MVGEVKSPKPNWAKFNAHLDECRQCADQPFNICEIGASLLRRVGEAAHADWQPRPTRFELRKEGERIALYFSDDYQFRMTPEMVGELYDGVRNWMFGGLNVHGK